MTSILGIGECMIELSSEGRDLWRQKFSGDVFNSLWYARAHSLNDTEIGFHTAVGTDPMSDQLLSFVQSCGIRCDDTPRIADRRPGLYTIHLHGAERSFTYWRDTSAARMMVRQPGSLWRKVAAADVIYFSGITLAILPQEDLEDLLVGLEQHKKDGAVLAFDPNIRPHLWQDKNRMLDVITRAATQSDLVLPSFDDEATAFGDATPEISARRYANLGVDHVVVKNGASDTIHLQAGQMTAFPVAPVEGVVDTTAAGDSFNGAYIASLLRGLSIKDAIRTAQNCAGQVIRHKGAIVPLKELAPDA
ncbi:2-dehydro-3-deoxygluconokinase [Roseovarius sp. A-2]|uniref:sugar kinase n=1 Tax=Roseovarius sp. A-2 TaxID=1570360 RepID=UPI0009B54A53|nr:sugar kinase [Roseovarius sp. A-2]GAW36371.1 2-dehydro-3-deoxygluconokinase [Roseovarius sp. A-2]